MYKSENSERLNNFSIFCGHGNSYLGLFLHSHVRHIASFPSQYQTEIMIMVLGHHSKFTLL